MGWAVQCEGVELIHGLRATEEMVLGRIYGLYIIALATEVDDDSIRLLADYGRAIDSLTGDAIAFLVFYNSARLYAHANTLRTPPATSMINFAGTELVFKRALQEYAVPPSALDSSWDLTDHIRGRYRFPDEAFVSSMTYQSDRIARALGIKAVELPCLVLIDDPASVDYYTVPMDSDGAALMRRLREIVGEYYAHEGHQEWVALMERWDSLQRESLRGQNKLRSVDQEIEREVQNLPTGHLIVAGLPHAELVVALEQVGRWAAAVYGHNIPSELSREINAVSGWIGYLGRLARAEIKINYFLQALDHGPLTAADRVKLERFYRKQLRYLIPERKGGWIDEGPDVLRQAFDLAVSRANPKTEEVTGRLARLQELIDRSPLDEIRASRLAPLMESRHRVSATLRDIEDQITRIRDALQHVARPRIGPILKRMKWGERRQLVISSANSAAAKIASGADSVLKAIELGMKALGNL